MRNKNKRKNRDCGIYGKVSIILLISLSLFIGLSLFFAVNNFSSYALAGTSALADTSEVQAGMTVIYKSPFIWRTPPDTGQADRKGDYLLSKLVADAVHELTGAIKVSGQIESLTATWEFKGQVILEISADNGQNYSPVIYGVPLTSGFISGNQLKWRVTLGHDSELSEIKIAYTDTSGVAGTFGNPALSGFEFRKPIYISRGQFPAGTVPGLFNYQIKVEVKEEDIRTEADFADIRFTATDKETLLSHYLESITGDKPARIATYYVKVPQLPEGGLKIYLYYGNPDAIDMSDAEKVFDLFDDFNEELNPLKWEIETKLNGEYDVSNSLLKLDAAGIISKDYQIEEGIIEYRAKSEAGYEARAIIREDKENPSLAQLAYSSNYDGAEHCIAIGNIVKANIPEPISADIFYDYRVVLKETDLIFERYAIRDTQYAIREAFVTYDDTSGLTKGYVGLETGGTGDGDSVAYYDWIRVRKYAEAEPSVSALGDEEKVYLAQFINTMVADNGNLVLASAEGIYSLSGTYITAPIFTTCDIKMIIPMIKADDKKALVDISANGGIDWKEGCKSNKVYIVSDDFKTGKHLLLRVNLSTMDVSAAQEVEELKLEYSIAPVITSTNIHCSGATGMQEIYISGDTITVKWDNSSKGDNNPDIFSVSCSFESFGSESAARMYDDNDGIYTVSYKLPEAIDATANIVVTATNLCGISASAGRILTANTFPEEAVLQEEVAEQEIAIDSEEVLDLEEDLDMEEELAEEGQRPGTRLYDVVVKLGDNYNPDPEEDARGCYKHGEIVIVRPSGHLWSETERSSFLIVQAYLTPEEAQNLTKPKEIATDELDKDGRPVIKKIKRRAKRLQLEKLGLSKTDKRKEKLREVSDHLKFSSLTRGVIEEKE